MRVCRAPAGILRPVYDSIQGTVLAKSPTATTLRAGGIGYVLRIPLSTYEALPSKGENAHLWVHLVVREDEWRMFGFATNSEREVFRALIRVSGVGPVVALSLLSGFEPRELQASVSHGDVASLTRVKGVGKKTAERIVVELREVFSQTADDVPAPMTTGTATHDAVRALINLGLTPADAAKRVERCVGEVSDPTQVGEIVRLALRM